MGMKPEREDTTNLMRTKLVSSLLDMETQLLLVAPSSSTWPTLIAAEALIFLSIPALSLTTSQCEWPDLVISEIELRSVGRADRSLTRCSMHAFTLVNDSWLRPQLWFWIFLYYLRSFIIHYFVRFRAFICQETEWRCETDSWGDHM